MKKPKNNLDYAVESVIHDLYPGHYVPDENNYLPDGTNYPAPDHLVCDDQVLIERKSLNPEDEHKVIKKLTEIAVEQGSPFVAFGTVNSAALINKLPNPDAANYALADHMFKKITDNFRETRKKFTSYAQVTNSIDTINVLIVSDHAKIISSSMAVEHYIGRKMGGYKVSEDKADFLDCVIYIKDPRFSLQIKRGYWFKVLIRDKLSDVSKEILREFSLNLHIKLYHHKDYCRAAEQFSGDKLRFLYV